MSANAVQNKIAVRTPQGTACSGCLLEAGVVISWRHGGLYAKREFSVLDYFDHHRLPEVFRARLEAERDAPRLVSGGRRGLGTR